MSEQDWYAMNPLNTLPLTCEFVAEGLRCVWCGKTLADVLRQRQAPCPCKPEEPHVS